MKSRTARAQGLVVRVAQALAGRQLTLSGAARAARVAVAAGGGGTWDYSPPRPTAMPHSRVNVLSAAGGRDSRAAEEPEELGQEQPGRSSSGASNGEIALAAGDHAWGVRYQDDWLVGVAEEDAEVGEAAGSGAQETEAEPRCSGNYRPANRAGGARLCAYLKYPVAVNLSIGEVYRTDIKESVGPLGTLEPDSDSDSLMPELVEVIDDGGPLQVDELPDKVAAAA